MTFFIYVITYLCIIATFFNDGFSGMFFSLPFILFLLVDSVLDKGFRRFMLNTIAVTTLLVLALTRFSNPYIYPVLKYKLITKTEYHLTHSPYHTATLIDVNNLHDYFESDKRLERYKEMDLYKEYVLKKGTLITPVKVIISGHPDISGISYNLQIDINDSQLEDEVKHYIVSHHKDIGMDINNRLPQKEQDNYLHYYRPSIPNSSDAIYAGRWYFKDFSKEETNSFTRAINSVVEGYLGWVVYMFNPMFIWAYLIIFVLQLFYIKKKYNLGFKKNHRDGN